MTTKQFLELNADAIASAYIGKAGKCCCGCEGTHYSACTIPGISTDDDVQVRRILNQIKAESEVNPTFTIDASSNVSVEIGPKSKAKLWVVYFSDAFKAAATEVA